VLCGVTVQLQEPEFVTASHFFQGAETLPRCTTSQKV